MNILTRKSMLLASAAVVVMGLGAMSKPAMAFDEVSWVWDATVTENVMKDVTVSIDTSPSGMVQLEKIQMQVGDVNATSTVTNFTNNPPIDLAGGGAPAPAPEPSVYTIDLQAFYDDNAMDNPVEYIDLLNSEETGIILSNDTGHVDNNDENVYLTFDLTVPSTNPAAAPTPEGIAIGERLAVDLPQVASAATAVGNNQDLASSVSMDLHDAQFLFGGYGGADDGSLAGLFDPEAAGNSHTNTLSSLIGAGSQGLITPAAITADSTVTGILNATVDSSATAVGNNMSIDLAAFTPEDAFMVADVTQFSYANVTATSLVDDVTVEGYSEFGFAGMGSAGGIDPVSGDAIAQIPAINSVATAVGNNFSLKVSSPDL